LNSQEDCQSGADVLDETLTLRKEARIHGRQTRLRRSKVIPKDMLCRPWLAWVHGFTMMIVDHFSWQGSRR